MEPAEAIMSCVLCNLLLAWLFQSATGSMVPSIGPAAALRFWPTTMTAFLV
jgi:hypothetical protein